jgi:hypothetical protein
MIYVVVNMRSLLLSIVAPYPERKTVKTFKFTHTV